MNDHENPLEIVLRAIVQATDETLWEHELGTPQPFGADAVAEAIGDMASRMLYWESPAGIARKEELRNTPRAPIPPMTRDEKARANRDEIREIDEMVITGKLTREQAADAWFRGDYEYF